jgi:hypothetical protein
LFSHRFEAYFQICQIIRNGLYAEGGKESGGFNDEFMEKLEKCKFLIDESDFKKLDSLLKNSLLKTEIKDGHPVFIAMKGKPDDVIKQIDTIFEKYLLVDKYGKW